MSSFLFYLKVFCLGSYFVITTGLLMFFIYVLRAYYERSGNRRLLKLANSLKTFIFQGLIMLVSGGACVWLYTKVLNPGYQ